MIETEFECIEKFGNKDQAAILCHGTRIIIGISKCTMSTKELAESCRNISENIKNDEEKYFITKYS